MTTKTPLLLSGGITSPVDKTLEWISLMLFRLRGGKVVEERTHMDWLTVLEPVGAGPTTART